MAKKISIFIIIIAFIITVIPIKAYAGSIFDDVIDPNLYTVPPTTESPQLMTVVNTILGIIQVAGSILSVGALMVIGIKYMMAGLEEKAQYKETMVPYVIGIILLFAGVNILKVIADLASKILK